MIAEETSRLRRLDALFAEKVLGCKVAVDPLDGESILFQIEHDLWGKIPAYTRSLDAAWEGVEAVTKGSLLLCLESGTTDGPHSPTGKDERFYFAAWSDYRPEECGERIEADHPAEALVLACLRAVGVSEEELK